MYKSDPNVLYLLNNQNSLAVVNNLYLSLMKKSNSDLPLDTTKIARKYNLQISLDKTQKDELVKFYSKLLDLNSKLEQEKTVESKSKGLIRILAHAIHIDN